MKKLITSVFALALTFSVANAQDNTPKSGDWSVGTNAAPVLNYVGNLISGTAEAPGVNFTDGMSLSGKLFTDDMTAWRASADLYFTSDSNSTNPFRLGLSAGKEFRKGTSNLQGYYGYAANVAMSSNEDEAGEKSTDMSFGANGFIGVEYFVRAKMGIGAEYSYGLNYADSNVSLGGSMGAVMLNLYF
jgi:hypothetical protein